MFLDWLNYPAVAKGGDIFILWYYFGGVGLGLIVLAVTSLIVPDPPPPPKALFTSKDKASIRPQQQLRQAEEEEQEEEAKKPSNNDNGNNNKEEKENKTDPFDLPPNQIEKIRKTFRLTHAQMEEVLDESRRQHNNNNNNNNDEGIGGMGSSLLSSSSLSSWTPHQKMNGLAYLLMLSVLVYVLNRDYGNVVTIWFVQTFPKEARTLGLLHPLP